MRRLKRNRAVLTTSACSLREARRCWRGVSARRRRRTSARIRRFSCWMATMLVLACVRAGVLLAPDLLGPDQARGKLDSPEYRCRNSPEPHGSGGGQSGASGFPSSGHAHSAFGQGLRFVVSAQEHFQLANIPGRACIIAPDSALSWVSWCALRFRSGDWREAPLRSSVRSCGFRAASRSRWCRPGGSSSTDHA